MAGPHDPDHASSAGLALRADSEETAQLVSTKEERAVNDSRTPPRFWLVLATLVPGLAALAIGFIFFSALPGTLAAETIGAGLALLAVSVLLLTGVWGPAKGAQPVGALAVAPVAAPDHRDEPSSPAVPASPDIAPQTPAQTAPTTTTSESSIDDITTPGTAHAPASDASSADQNEAAVAASPDAPTAPSASPGATPKGPASQGKQNGHAAPAAPRTRASRAPVDDTPLPLPPTLNLAQQFPPFAGSAQLEFEPEALSKLLGDVAEQTVTAVVTRGQPGKEHRARLAEKIDAFRRDLAVDPNYAPIVAYLEAMVALLRAGKPIAASTPLVDPFDQLYEYVLTLIQRKTRGR